MPRKKSSHELETVISSYEPILSTRARHRHFFKSRQKRAARRLLERDEDDDDDDDSVKSSDSGDDSSSITTLSLTISTPVTAAATLAATTTSLRGVTSTSTSEAAASSNLAAITTSSAGAGSSSAVVPTTHAVQVQSSLTTSIQTSPASSQSTAVSSSTILAGPATTSEAVSEKSSTISKSSIALVVFGVLGAFVIALATIWFIRLHLRRSQDSSHNTVAQEKPSVQEPAQQRESKIWGGSSTVGTLTEANFPVSQIPASIQPGGKYYNANTYSEETSGPRLSNELRLGREPRSNYINPSNHVNASVAYLAPVREIRGKEADDQYFLRHISNRWPSAIKEPMPSVWNFRDIKLWSENQTRGSDGGNGDVPTTEGPYKKI